VTEPPGDADAHVLKRQDFEGPPIGKAMGVGDAGMVAGAGRKAPHGSHPSRDLAPCYAAIDLGTNNCRLLVARPSRRGFLVVDAFSRIIRLGEGVSQTGRLSDIAMRRTIDALKVCAEKMRRRGVRRSRLIATEACRIAANSGDFIRAVREETGLAIEIVTPETEATLAVSGCASLLDRNSDWALVFDIGGGSSELILLDLRRRGRGQAGRFDASKSIAAWTSLPLGVVTLSERYGGRDVDAPLYERMIADVAAHVRAFDAREDIGRRVGSSRIQLLGTSGTVTTIAGVHLGLKAYDRIRVDGAWIRTEDARAASRRLLAMSYAERAGQPCIGPDRADLVLAGCAILEGLLEVWSSDRLRVADRGLREGILTALMAEDGHYRRPPAHRRAHRGGQRNGAD
jgi:exopolyphosphatase/guanosine-5'-triphosphate,3'-diphosphate pyrophosphatase